MLTFLSYRVLMNTIFCSSTKMLPAPKSQRPPKITQSNPHIQDKLWGSHTIDSSRYSILFVLNLNQFPEHRFTDSAMFSKITSLFLNNLSFLAIQMPANQITLRLLTTTLPLSHKPWNWSKWEVIHHWVYGSSHLYITQN